jgi:exosome complex component RRP42
VTQLGEGELEFQRIMPLVREGLRFAEDLAKAVNLKLKDA